MSAFQPQPPDAAGVVRWGKLPVALITSPSDERLLTQSSEIHQRNLKTRANFWGNAEAIEATAHLDGQTIPMKRVHGSRVWAAEAPNPRLGTHSLSVSFKDAQGHVATDRIQVAIGPRTERRFAERDQDNALAAWPKHGLLGTQPGPNKNGKKW